MPLIAALGVALGVILAAAIALRYYCTKSDPARYFTGKVVIVTGASEGIGAALAFELARYGCKLVICARREEQLRKVAQRCQTVNPDVLPVVTDVSSEEQCRRLVERTVAAYGALDVVLLNAALSVSKPFERCTPKDFAQHMDVNFMQAVYIIGAALPHLQRRHGKVVAISSLAGFVATYGTSPYTASKMALQGLMQNLRQELGARVDFVLLPIGEVNTATAVGNMRPKSTASWLSPEECAAEIASVTASRRLNYIGGPWGNYFGATLRPLFPWLFDWLTLRYQRQAYAFLDGSTK